MKLRIRGDSLRLRLTRGEVDQLRETGEVNETIHFGPRALTYSLRRAEVEDPRAAFVDDRVEVALPVAIVEQWTGSNQVGVEAEQPLDAGVLRLLIEKDFKCLAPREGEDDADAFPHPGGESGATC